MYGMRKSRLSKLKQDRLMVHFVAGTTARCAASLVNVNRNTSAYYFHQPQSRRKKLHQPPVQDDRQ